MKFLLIAVFMLYPKGATPYVEKVEVMGTFKTLSACQKETNVPFGLQQPGVAFLDCVPLKKS